MGSIIAIKKDDDGNYSDNEGGMEKLGQAFNDFFMAKDGGGDALHDRNAVIQKTFDEILDSAGEYKLFYKFFNDQGLPDIKELSWKSKPAMQLKYSTDGGEKKLKIIVSEDEPGDPERKMKINIPGERRNLIGQGAYIGDIIHLVEGNNVLENRQAALASLVFTRCL